MYQHPAQLFRVSGDVLEILISFDRFGDDEIIQTNNVQNHFFCTKNYESTPLTVVREIAISTTLNHIFELERRTPTPRRAQNRLPLSHTHGSAPGGSRLPRQILDQWKNSELEQSYGISYGKKSEARGASNSRFKHRFGKENK